MRYLLPNRFNAKVLSLEEIQYLSKLTMNQLHGTLISYEMRTVKVDPRQMNQHLKYTNMIKNAQVMDRMNKKLSSS